MFKLPIMKTKKTSIGYSRIYFKPHKYYRAPRLTKLTTNKLRNEQTKKEQTNQQQTKKQQTKKHHTNQ